MKHDWVFARLVPGFPAKYYKCSFCNIKGIALWTLGGYTEIKIFEEDILFNKCDTCKEFIIKNIIE